MKDELIYIFSITIVMYWIVATDGIKIAQVESESGLSSGMITIVFRG